MSNFVSPLSWEKIREHLNHYWQYYLGIFLFISILRLIFSGKTQVMPDSINIWFIILAGFSYLLNNILMSFRLRRILSHLDVKTSFSQVFSSHMGGMLLSDFTPGRSGYLSVAVFFNRKGIRYEKGLASITGTFIYEFLFKLGLALLSVLFMYTTIFGNSMLICCAATAGIIISLIILYLLVVYPPGFVLDLGQRFSFINRLLETGRECQNLHVKVPFVIFISGICWILRGFEWYCLAMAIGISSIQFSDALFLNPLLTLLSFVPISPSGIGFQESGIVGVFSILGIGLTLSLWFALLVRFIETGIDLIGLFEVFPQVPNAIKKGLSCLMGKREA
ncbi:MAG TPA: lysylphosphatidylglycerol synthase transmembrane domain-containing protein [Methanospirillum sp.]|uniref:lysylphosphatidylglycerol synthase transmembrane domain-containing protein n=1 Tax=Methanospirillum sp. TaxID=45200 RepID=UPI002C63C155|nr:lysylphosphatidylglycerol synthase transmembrane domain-containing protein [Methanospirillum sp.]HWQ63730.1 lysylphosphatidylglycerol synthase transmembrane domain-containing protein [Methanospirillum sp.]